MTSAQTLLDLVRGDEWRPIFFGGDLNAHRNQREVQLLTDAGLREACPVPAPDPATCAMIDHVYSRGPYTATSYRHSFRARGDPRDPTHPSDHPFVLVTYQRR